MILLLIFMKCEKIKPL